MLGIAELKIEKHQIETWRNIKIDKEKLFQKAYDAVMNESEFEPSNIEDDSDVFYENEEYKKACMAANTLFWQIDEAGFLQEYMEWIYKKIL